jgi:hypothetical protein
MKALLFSMLTLTFAFSFSHAKGSRPFETADTLKSKSEICPRIKAAKAALANNTYNNLMPQVASSEKATPKRVKSVDGKG